MDEDNLENGVDELIEHSVTIKDIISDLVKDSIALVVVFAVVYLAIQNNTVDVLSGVFQTIIGFYIGVRANK